MAIRRIRPDLELDKFTENADGNVAVRVVLTNAAPGDQPGPTNLELSNDTVEEGLPSGSFVGTLTVTDGIAPLVFTITQDLGNAFQISGNQLQTSRPLVFSTEPNLNVSIRCTDNNGKFVDATFLIMVTEAGGFQNLVSYQLNGAGYLIFNSSQFQLGSNESINIWYRTKAIGSEQYLCGGRNGTNNSGLVISILSTANANDLRVWYTTSDNRTIDFRYNFPAAYNENKWHMVTLTRDNSNVYFYLDGSLLSVANTVTNQVITGRAANNTKIHFGANVLGTSNFYTGKLDEISYHAIQLNGTQIASIYNNRSATDLNTTLTASQFRNWYRADGDSLPAITDKKGTINGSSVSVITSPLTPVGYFNNYSAYFDGITNYFSGSGASILSAAKTFSFWVKRDTTSSNHVVYGTQPNIGNLNSINIYFDNNPANRILFHMVAGGGGVDIIRANVGNVGSWVHIAITMPASNVTASNVAIYVNGVSVATTVISDTAAGIPTLPTNISFGANTTGNNKFNGNIDEFSVFGIQANSSQVSELYNLGTPPNLLDVSFNSTITQWWRFGDKNARGAVMTDIIGEKQAVMINYNISYYELDVP